MELELEQPMSRPEAGQEQGRSILSFFTNISPLLQYFIVFIGRSRAGAGQDLDRSRAGATQLSLRPTQLSLRPYLLPGNSPPAPSETLHAPSDIHSAPSETLPAPQEAFHAASVGPFLFGNGHDTLQGSWPITTKLITKPLNM